MTLVFFPLEDVTETCGDDDVFNENTSMGFVMEFVIFLTSGPSNIVMEVLLVVVVSMEFGDVVLSSDWLILLIWVVIPCVVNDNLASWLAVDDSEFVDEDEDDENDEVTVSVVV